MAVFRHFYAKGHSKKKRKTTTKKTTTVEVRDFHPIGLVVWGGGGGCYKIIAKFLATPLHSHGRYHFSFISFQLQENSQTCTYY